ncbi:MAG: sugar ABC transporter permease [Chloroflexota bacterium]|jgi:ABC-type glycerol-3-phosphate transport system permease component|nr:carbohydrate ABC transporter permease [Caldilinea sp.]GIK72959.1 MAG: sugar ABC transporter permease [Chloroflexota bacterium]
MTNIRRLRHFLITVLLYAVLAAISLFMLIPFIWMLSTSFKLPEDVFGFPPVLFSERSTLLNYEYLLREKNLLRIVGNTFFVAASATLLSLFFCSLGGYGFAKYRFPGRTALFSFLLATMIIPSAVTMVPNFVIMRQFGWVDTFWPLIVPGAANAFGIFFMRQYISSISDELLDAARIDGAHEFGIYWRVIVPIIVPGLTSLGMIFFMGSWNNYLGPLIFLKSPEKFTLPLAIFSFGGAVGLTNYTAQMAMSVISLIPLLIIFLVFQRRFVEGITAGAVKG